MRRAWLCILLILILLLCGCAAQKPAPETTAEPAQTQSAAETAPYIPEAESVDLLEGLDLSAAARKTLESYGEDLYGIHRLTDGWYLLWMSTKCGTYSPLYGTRNPEDTQLAVFSPEHNRVVQFWTPEVQRSSLAPMFYDYSGVRNGTVSYSRMASFYAGMKSTWLFIITPNLLADGTEEAATAGAVPYDTLGSELIVFQRDDLNNGDPIWIMEVPYRITEYTDSFALYFGDYSFTRKDFITHWPDGFMHPEYLPEEENPIGTQVLEASKAELSKKEYAFFSEHLPYLRGLKKLDCGAVLCWYSTQVDFGYYEQYGEDFKFGVLAAENEDDTFCWYWLANASAEMAGTDIFYRTEEERLQGRSCMFPGFSVVDYTLYFVSTDGENVPYDSIGTEPIIFDQPDCNNGKPLYIFEVNMYEAPDDYTLYYGDYTVTKDQFYALEWEP